MKSLSEQKKAYIAQKRALIILLVVVFSAFIATQIRRAPFFTEYYEHLYEYLLIPVMVAACTLVFIIIIYIYLLRKYLKLREKKRFRFFTMIQIILIVISLLFVSSVTIYQTQDVSTFGFFLVVEKEQENNNYYLIIENGQHLKISENVYHFIEPNQQYILSYLWNKNRPMEGKIKKIEPIIYSN